MEGYRSKEAKDWLKKIEAQYRDGLLKIDYEKDRNVDHYIAVTHGNVTYTDCKELIDVYRDLEGNLAYTVRQHIDRSKNYHTINVDVHENGFMSL
tara:strand:+ start:1123 stop:1407 length:285 start_codon:yes stop_codon:yes gene_type:complete